LFPFYLPLDHDQGRWGRSMWRLCRGSDLGKELTKSMWKGKGTGRGEGYCSCVAVAVRVKTCVMCNFLIRIPNYACE
jgi:hypothetical protein